MINLDFADVRNLLANSGTVLMGIGAGRGDKMAEEAARNRRNRIEAMDIYEVEASKSAYNGP